MDDLLEPLVLAVGLIPAALILIAVVLAVRRRLAPRERGGGRSPMRPVMDAGAVSSNLYGVRAVVSEEILRDDVDAVHSEETPAGNPQSPHRSASEPDTGGSRSR